MGKMCSAKVAAVSDPVLLAIREVLSPCNNNEIQSRSRSSVVLKKWISSTPYHLVGRIQGERIIRANLLGYVLRR